MKLLSLIESTKLKVSEDQSYDDLRVAKYLCRIDGMKFSGYGRQSEYISKAEELRNNDNDKYKSILRQPSPSSDDSWSSANLNLKEGEERSIIQSGCVEKLVDEFSGRENQFENKEDFEYAIYQALEDLDVEDCVDPDMEVGGQRIGDFASGRVIDCCSSSSIIYDVMANMDETQIGEAKDPIKSDADQIIQQIIKGYGIDNLEDVFRQYYPQLSDEQVERFISKHKKPDLRLIKNEDADINDNMIGEPDNFYDAEQRQEAHKDLQNALQGNYMDDYIIDGDCPACGGSGYMDGEETFTNDDGEEEESSECDGFGNYGCDEGEMTYGSDGPSWVEIIKHDKRQADRRDAVANYPGDETVIKQIANMVRGMEDPRMAMQQMAVDYPQMGRRQRAELVSKGMKKAGLTSEGKSPHKKGSTKYKKHMAAKHASMGENMNENKWKEIETTSDYMLPVTMDNKPLDWPTYWEWEQSHGETNKNRASLRFGNYVKDAEQELNVTTEGEQHGNSKIYKKCWTGYSKVAGKKAGEKGSCKKNEGRIEDTFGTDTVDKHDKPKKRKKEESIQAGDELMIETADGEGIVVPVLHVVGENVLVGWDELAEDIVVEGARQLEELRKLAGLEEGVGEYSYTLEYNGEENGYSKHILTITNPEGESKVVGDDFTYFDQEGDELQAELESWFHKGMGVADASVDESINEEKNCGCGQDPCKTYGKIKEAEYQGRKVKLGKPTRGDVKKFKVYVKDPKTGNVKKVNFGHGGSSAKKAGQKTMKIKKSNPARRKSFRARHNCDNPGPRTKARYWSCRAW